MVFFASVWLVIASIQFAAAESCDSVEDGYTCSTEFSHSWGQYSGFFSVPSTIDASVPAECELTFVQMLSRHGARDPTAGKTATYNATVQRIHDSVTAYSEEYAFIKDYDYTLGADQLTTFGQQELINAGYKFFQRYAQLTGSNMPFFRSSDQDRVVESAQNWTQGFQQALLEQDAGTTVSLPYSILLLPEESGNNTLNHDLCTAFEDGPVSEIKKSAQTIWQNVFAPNITARLNENLPGANFTDDDTINFMDLCPYNTVADDEGTVSPFCNLFTTDEWQSYGYFQTLGKYYGYGPGNPLGPTQGVGFVNELIARATGQAVVDSTSTNSTLDHDNATFPLDRKLYADFSHDNDMIGIYGALGLFPADVTAPLSNTTRTSAEDAGGFDSAWLVPFSARMYVEKMQCGADAEEKVRIIVNDRVVPLQGCGADELGRCSLGAWVDSLSFATSGGLWNECFV
ncbi:acid phosphatase [Hypoxylon rubiginosum]|uniref:Acid phosphatase n=1 Tax=Hypoxylon rubiginosum TaxID=110542 RepID=A0ACC0D378_9PEZI|nr:acid phosphatase [Hypoxylon rubiginosum]